MTRVWFCSRLCALAGLAALSACGAPSAGPNFVVVTAAGFRPDDAACAPIDTPAIARLAATGVTFANAYTVQPVSSGAQAALVTGRYPSRFGLDEDLAYNPLDTRVGLPLGERTIADILAGGGYRTAWVGKWHLGAAPSHNPQKRGFDRFFGFAGGVHDYLRTDPNEYGNETLAPLLDGARPVNLDGYLTDVLADRATALAEEFSAEPFALFVAFNAPGGPPQAPQAALAPHATLADRDCALYLAKLSVLDSAVGRLLDTLSRSGVRNNTLVMLLGAPDAAAPTAAALDERALRMPFVASWPSRWPQGAIYRPPVADIDVAATLAARAGRRETHLDGVDLDALVHAGQQHEPHAALFFRRPVDGGFAVRAGRHKLVRHHRDGRIALYDVLRDAFETTDLLPGNAATAARLADLWRAWDARNTAGATVGSAESYRRRHSEALAGIDRDGRRAAAEAHFRIALADETPAARPGDVRAPHPAAPDGHGASPLAPPASTQRPRQAPNIVVIVADDLGVGDVGFSGAAVNTPNIDDLATHGVVFANAYSAAPVCSPARAALLTGRYPARIGVELNIGFGPADPRRGLPTGETLVPEYLANVGYRTGIVGKWHLGAAPRFNPLSRGFEHFFGFLAGQHDYVRSSRSKRGFPALVVDRRIANTDGYLTDVLTDKAIEFIDQQPNTPFFLYLAYNAPHPPWQAPGTRHAGHRRSERIRLAMVDALDTGVGRVIDALEASDVRDRTLVFFLSDHGAGETGDNGGFRGGKATLYEGGLRIPLVGSWPERWRGGTIYEPVVTNMDIAATALAASGVAPVADRPLDGVDLDPYLRGRVATAPHDAVFWRDRLQGTFAARAGPLKLVGRADAAALYDLSKDPSETHDILDGNRDAAHRLARRWNAWNDAHADGGPNISISSYARAVDIAHEKLAHDSRTLARQQRILIPDLGPGEPGR